MSEVARSTGRRSPEPDGRPRSVRVSLSVAEAEVIAAAAARAGLSSAAWLGQVGAAAAAESTPRRRRPAAVADGRDGRVREDDESAAGEVLNGVPEDGAGEVLGRPGRTEWGPVIGVLLGLREELSEQRRLLRNIGGNLNDVARYANSTGALAVETASVLGLVGRRVQHVEELLAVVDDAVASGVVARMAQRPGARGRRSGRRPASGVGVGADVVDGVEDGAAVVDVVQVDVGYVRGDVDDARVGDARVEGGGAGGRGGVEGWWEP